MLVRWKLRWISGNPACASTHRTNAQCNTTQFTLKHTQTMIRIHKHVAARAYHVLVQKHTRTFLCWHDVCRFLCRKNLSITTLLCNYEQFWVRTLLKVHIARYESPNLFTLSKVPHSCKLIQLHQRDRIVRHCIAMSDQGTTTRT